MFVKLKSLFLLFFFVGLTHSPKACICGSYRTFESEYQSSDLIFLGEIIKANDKEFLVVVSEYLKGSSPDTLRGEIRNSCSIFPEKNQIWLIYADIDSAVLLSTECGNSRPLDNFYLDQGFFPEPGPIEISKSESYISNHLIYSVELAELHFEISTMRHRRLQSFFEDQSKQNQNQDNYFIYFGLALSLMLNIIILFRLRR